MVFENELGCSRCNGLQTSSAKAVLPSQSVLLKLTQKGMNREDAYAVVQRSAMKTWETVRASKAPATGDEFKQTLLNDPEVSRYLTKEEIDELFDLKRHLRDVERTFKLVGLA